MPTLIATIALPLPLGMGMVNCYLLRAGEDFALVDTGAPGARATLGRELERLGCVPGKLKLILITHGDFDHTGNAAHLRRALGSRIGMHADDARMAEVGDMFAGRSRANALLRTLAPMLIGFGRAERFVPDLLLQDGWGLAEHGLDAQVISIPGHSKGSIGILTAEGEFFCGDLLENLQRPALNPLMDDPRAGLASVATLRGLGITSIYPGHGAPFSIDQLTVS